MSANSVIHIGVGRDDKFWNKKNIYFFRIISEQKSIKYTLYPNSVNVKKNFRFFLRFFFCLKLFSIDTSGDLRTFVRQDLSKSIIIRRAFKAVLHHSIANNFSGTFMISNHDTLVHDDSFGLGSPSHYGHTNDIKF